MTSLWRHYGVMDLSEYVDQLQRELAVAARAGGADAEQLAERLTPSLEAATRLVIQEAVSDAAQEISRDLAPGSVDVRLRGRDLGFVVDRGPQDRAPGAPPPTAPAPPPLDDPQDARDDASTARITVRLPEATKGRLEAAAEREGLSLNAFLVRILGAATQPAAQPPASDHRATGNQLSGWVQ
jgi:hypothetical protein